MEQYPTICVEVTQNDLTIDEWTWDLSMGLQVRKLTYPGKAVLEERECSSCSREASGFVIRRLSGRGEGRQQIVVASEGVFVMRRLNHPHIDGGAELGHQNGGDGARLG